MNRQLIALIVISSALTACRWDKTDDKAASTGLPPNNPAQNRPPQISGAPTGSLVAGSAYNFLPQASDPDGQSLVFAVTGKPAWATFDTSTGRLQGTPGTSNIGLTSGIVISVSDGIASASLAAFSIQVNAVTTSNRPPTISGTPVTAATAGQSYSFTPVASDPDGQALTFSINNKPGWATFNTSTGQLVGTPTSANLGTNAGVVINVSDGIATASLPSFAVAVNMPAGTAELSWTKPTRNDDGTNLTDLAGYKVRYGTSNTALSQLFNVANGDIMTTAFQGLAAGTWYFTVASYTLSGVESAQSGVVSVGVR